MENDIILTVESAEGVVVSGMTELGTIAEDRVFAGFFPRAADRGCRQNTGIIPVGPAGIPLKIDAVTLYDALALHGISPLPRVARTEKGKPYFPDFPNLHFSLSHTNGASLCALSDSLVGVDIEPVDNDGYALVDTILTD